MRGCLEHPVGPSQGILRHSHGGKLCVTVSSLRTDRLQRTEYEQGSPQHPLNVGNFVQKLQQHQELEYKLFSPSVPTCTAGSGDRTFPSSAKGCETGGKQLGLSGPANSCLLRRSEGGGGEEGSLRRGSTTAPLGGASTPTAPGAAPTSETVRRHTPICSWELTDHQ